MSWLPLFIKNWQLIGVAILLSIIGWQHTRSQRDALEIEGLKAQSRLESVVRESAVREAKSKSVFALERNHDLHKTLVSAAEKNAWANFKRRYPNADRNFLGSGICRNPVVGLRDTSPAAADSPDASPAAPNESAAGIVVTDGGLLESFAKKCAADSGAILEWQQLCKDNPDKCKVVPDQ